MIMATQVQNSAVILSLAIEKPSPNGTFVRAFPKVPAAKTG